MFSKALSCCGPLAFAAALAHPGVGRAQFRLPPAGTAPPGYRSSTLPPRYGSSTLPPVPRYGMPYHPQTFEPTAPPQQEGRDEALTPGRDTAVITAHVPKDAELRFDRVKVTGTGEVRQFKSPPLQPGLRYAYTVEARWKEGGREVTQSRRLPVFAGANVEVTFPLPLVAPPRR
ncbi:MAG TPA: TIGR03000 domain-containing protein [Gemmataceae bacterium]|jgi:uncharacterized protein (TIGR03000 family)|nr:TIGR03000 domain-containing protein [Gemmataceae bacterium]